MIMRSAAGGNAAKAPPAPLYGAGAGIGVAITTFSTTTVSTGLSTTCGTGGRLAGAQLIKAKGKVANIRRPISAFLRIFMVCSSLGDLARYLPLTSNLNLEDVVNQEKVPSLSGLRSEAWGA